MPKISVRSWLLAAPLLLPPASPAARQHEAATPAAVVRMFYRYHFAHDMAFTPAAVRLRARWLAPDLLARCRAYFAKPGSPDQVPAIDGDPFTDSQEYPASFRVGRAQTSRDTALVPVTFSWKSGERRTVTAVLVRGGRPWRLADLRYEAGKTFRSLLAAKP